MTDPHLMGWSCPVEIAAEQRAFGVTQLVISQEDTSDPGKAAAARSSRTSVQVTLRASKAWAFRSAQVAVSYMVPTEGVMMVHSAGGVPAEKTYELSAGVDVVQMMDRGLALGSAVHVMRVTLVSLTYADGTVWKPEAAYNCSVRMGRAMLLDAVAR